MKLSTKTRYAVRALLDLNSNFENTPVSIKDIAKRENISERYLENIFHALKNAGYLNSIKGKGGGFSLNTPLNEINLLQLIETLEGELLIVECVGDNFTCKKDNCQTSKLWSLINKKMKDTLSSITLADIETYKRRNKWAQIGHTMKK